MVGHNNGPPIDQAARQTLFHRDREQYNRKLAEKQRADAEFRNTCKLISRTSGPLQLMMIKFANKIAFAEGEREQAEILEGQLEVARWMGAPLGTQFKLDLLGPDDVQKARQEGENAGRSNQPCRPPGEFIPGSDLYRAWTDGWTDGQAKAHGGYQRPPESIMERGPSDLQ
jgi:hypothetical protein